MYQLKSSRYSASIIIIIIAAIISLAADLSNFDLTAVNEQENLHKDQSPDDPIITHTGNQFISLSDIHFNPFFDTSLVSTLIDADVSQWEGILQTTQGYGSFVRHAPGFDTPFPLFRSALNELKKIQPNPDFITISGDFQCHDFEATFQAVSGLKDQQSLYNFSAKTIAFIGHMLGKTFPNAPVFPTLGNNDSFCGDYNVQAKGPFLDSMTTSWSNYVNRAGVTSTFNTDFPAYGNYVADLPGSNNRIIGLNTIFFSNNYGNSWSRFFCTPIDAPANEVFSWLGETLKKSKGKDVWLLYHIPPGINTFHSDQIPRHDPDSCNVVVNTAALFMNCSDNAQLLDTIRKYAMSGVIKANLAGHSHMNEIRMIYDVYNNPVSFIHVSPSISPINDNNPAIAVYTYDKDPVFQITNTETWYFQGIQKPGQNKWVKEFDFSQYGESAMTAATMQNIYEDIRTDYSSRQLYLKNYYSSRNINIIHPNQERALECAISQTTVEGFRQCYCNAN